MAIRPAYFAGKALDSMRRTPLVQLLAVSTVAVALLVLGVVLTALHHVDRLAARWGSEGRVVAFLAEGVPASRAPSVQAAVAAWPGVASVKLRTPEESLADLRQALGKGDDLLAGIGADLMPASIEIALDGPADPATVDGLAGKLRKVPDVGDVQSVDTGADLVERLQGIRALVRLAGIVVGSLVVLAVVFIVSNTIRLTLYARRDEIEILQLVGATHAFIRAPFYIEGGLQGAGGGALAVAFLWALHRLAVTEGPRLTGGALALDGLRLPPAPALVALAGGAALVGVLSSHFAVGRFLRGRQPA